MLGELSIADYANAVIETMVRLDEEKIRPHTLVGHSMGGIVLQTVQDQLVGQGSSLWKAFHVGHVLLMAPVPPASSPFGFRDGGAGAGLLPFASVQPGLGYVLSFPPEVLIQVAFATPLGVIPANAPTPAEVTANGWMSPESMTAAGGFLGIPGFVGADVAPGIFAPSRKTELDIVAFEQDAIITPADLVQLVPYLTGQPAVDGHNYVLVAGDDATHGLPLVDPDAVLSALTQHMHLP